MSEITKTIPSFSSNFKPYIKQDIDSNMPLLKENFSFELNINKKETSNIIKSENSRDDLECKLKDFAKKNKNIKYLLKAKYENERFAFLLRHKYRCYNKKNLLPKMKIYKEFNINTEDPFEYFTKHYFYENRSKPNNINKDLVLTINTESSKTVDTYKEKKERAVSKKTFITENEDYEFKKQLPRRNNSKYKLRLLYNRIFDKSIEEATDYNSLLFIDYNENFNNTYEELSEPNKLGFSNLPGHLNNKKLLNPLGNGKIKKGLTGILRKGNPTIGSEYGKDNPFTPFGTGLDYSNNHVVDVNKTTEFQQKVKLPVPTLDKEVFFSRMEKIIDEKKKISRNQHVSKKKNILSSSTRKEHVINKSPKEFWEAKNIEERFVNAQIRSSTLNFSQNKKLKKLETINYMRIEKTEKENNNKNEPVSREFFNPYKNFGRKILKHKEKDKCNKVNDQNTTILANKLMKMFDKQDVQKVLNMEVKPIKF
jgi:hypothetical protein